MDDGELVELRRQNDALRLQRHELEEMMALFRSENRHKLKHYSMVSRLHQQMAENNTKLAKLRVLRDQLQYQLSYYSNRLKEYDFNDEECPRLQTIV